MDWIIALDRSIIFSVQDMVVTPWLTPLMRFISFIGEYAGILVLLPIRPSEKSVIQLNNKIRPNQRNATTGP